MATPSKVVICLSILLFAVDSLAQTHTMPGSNVVPSGASLTIQSGGSITAAAGSTVTGFGGGGGGNVSNSGTPTAGQKALWTDATHIQGVTDNSLQWDGGATNLVAATGRTSLGLVIGTNVQAFDADLTTWAGITPTAGIQTWLATPSSANLRSAVSDENGTGTLLFNGATTPDFTTGLTIGGAAASRKILVGDGTKFGPSTETWPVPGTAGNQPVSDGTNWTSAAPVSTTWVNSSAVGVSGCCASNTIIQGSTITIPAGAWKTNGLYHCVFDMGKTAFGTGTIAINIHMGTAGTTSDAIVATITFGAAGTAAAETGVFDVFVNFKSVGSGTSAVITGYTRLAKVLTTTGLINSPATNYFTAVTSSGFNSTTQTKISLGFNGGASFSGTNFFAQTEYKQ